MTSTAEASLLSENYYSNFKNSIKTTATFVSYNYKLKDYMKHHNYTDYTQLIEGKDVKTIEWEIIKFINYMKEKHYAYSSKDSYLNAICHFYEINDIQIRRKKISKFLGNDDEELLQQREDKPYTREQIGRLLEFSDERTKAMILLMASTGLRMGALPTLLVGHLKPIQEYSIYQVTAYANSRNHRYHTFCTPECRKTIDNYLDFRKRCGEHITEKSPLFRTEFDKSDIFKVANKISPLSISAIKNALANVLYESGLREPLIERNKNKLLNYRRDVPMNHGFRKFFHTTCVNAGMGYTYSEFIMGHKLPGVKSDYFKPQPDENGIYRDILEGNEKNPGYLSAIDALTINEASRLKREVETLRIKKSEMDQMKEELGALRNFKNQTDEQLRIEESQFNELAIAIEELKKRID